MIRTQTKQSQRRTKRVIAKVKQEVRIRVVYQSEGGWVDPWLSFFKPVLPSMHACECVCVWNGLWVVGKKVLHTLTEHILDYQLSPTQNIKTEKRKKNTTCWVVASLQSEVQLKRAHLLVNRKVNFLVVFGDTIAVSLCCSVTRSAADSGLGLD